jgi:hypothetical protein
MSVVIENDLNSIKSPLKRRSFPLVQRLDQVFDIEKIKSELKKIAAVNGWQDMSKGSKLVEKLIMGRDRLTYNFQDESGDYSKYHQILLTEYDGDVEPEVEGVASGKFSQYKADVKKVDPRLDESKYNKLRSFMDDAPELRSVLNSFKDKIMRARLARVQPGFQIKPHIDYDIPYGTRYHLVLDTNEKCHIGIRRSPNDRFEEFHLPCDGHLYFVNVGHEHYASNFGATERTHLVVSVDGHQDILPYRLK